MTEDLRKEVEPILEKLEEKKKKIGEFFEEIRELEMELDRVITRAGNIHDYLEDGVACIRDALGEMEKEKSSWTTEEKGE